jgi:hypothetical protein
MRFSKKSSPSGEVASAARDCAENETAPMATTEIESILELCIRIMSRITVRAAPRNPELFGVTSHQHCYGDFGVSLKKREEPFLGTLSNC